MLTTMTNARMITIVDTIFVVEDSTTITKAVLHVLATLTQIVEMDGSVVSMASVQHQIVSQKMLMLPGKLL